MAPPIKAPPIPNDIKAYNTITLIRIDDAVWEIIDGYWYKNGVNQGIKAQGKDGLDGLSAYELAVIGGYEGTETEFNDELASMEDTRQRVDNLREVMDGLITDISGLYATVATTEDIGVINQAIADYLTTLESEIERITGIEGSVSHLLERDQTVVFELNETVQRWNFIDNYMVAGEEGLLIGGQSTGAKIFIKPDSIDFLDGDDEPVARITNQMLIIDRGIFVQSATIGEHKIETLTGGHTVFSWMGG